MNDEIKSDAEICRFPGVDEVSASTEPQVSLEELVAAQEILLERWQAFGEEVKRRVDGIPFDLRFDLCELLRETGA